MVEITEKQLREATTPAARLKLALLARGMSQPALAKRIGVKRQTVHYWMTGATKNIDSSNLFAVAKVLGIRPRWLVTGELPMYPSPKMDEEAIQLVGYFEAMTPEAKQTLLKAAEAFAASPSVKASPAAPYRTTVRKK